MCIQTLTQLLQSKAMPAVFLINHLEKLPVREACHFIHNMMGENYILIRQS